MIGISGKVLCPVCYSDLCSEPKPNFTVTMGCQWCETVTHIRAGVVEQVHRKHTPQPPYDQISMLTAVEAERIECQRMLSLVIKRINGGIARGILSFYGVDNLPALDPRHYRAVTSACIMALGGSERA